jgi:hypothetical protein
MSIVIITGTNLSGGDREMAIDVTGMPETIAVSTESTMRGTDILM